MSPRCRGIDVAGITHVINFEHPRLARMTTCTASGAPRVRAPAGTGVTFVVHDQAPRTGEHGPRPRFAQRAELGGLPIDATGQRSGGSQQRTQRASRNRPPQRQRSGNSAAQPAPAVA